MAVTAKPRCFVAMAFDHEDTDALYEGAIRPVLKANGILPVIINRREDNRDINHQIIEQLNACDFCITDLTYTRPSVYFEAGYAQRAVDVIYTVRSDHLLKNQPDDVRVHFDLQMKPLIKWTSPEDKTFPGRLERRLRSTVLRNWRSSQKEIQKEREDRDQFAHMPLRSRLIMLRRRAVSTVVRLGFSEWTPLVGPYLTGDSMGWRQVLAQVASLHWLLSERRQNRLLQVASVRIEESLPLQKLRDEYGRRFVSSNYVPHLKASRMVAERSPVNRTIEHYLLGSLRPVPQSRIMSAIPLLSWDASNSRYETVVEWQDSALRWRTTGQKRDSVKVQFAVSRTIYMYFVDGIRSLPEFQDRLNAIAEQIKGDQQRHAQRRG